MSQLRGVKTPGDSFILASMSEALGIGLAEAKTAGEAYDRVARAFDEGRLTPAQARVAVDLVKVRSTVVAAEEFRKRLELAEAMSRSAHAATRFGPLLVEARDPTGGGQ